MTYDKDWCEVPDCVYRSILYYYGHGVCDDHWLRDCDVSDDFNLKKIFSISDKKYKGRKNV